MDIIMDSTPMKKKSRTRCSVGHCRNNRKNKPMIIKLENKILNAVNVIAALRYSDRRISISSCWFVALCSPSGIERNSFIRVRDRSIVRASRLVKDNSSNPTPDIRTTGITDNCNSLANHSMCGSSICLSFSIVIYRLFELYLLFFIEFIFIMFIMQGF
jgi:hypothetical protein